MQRNGIRAIFCRGMMVLCAAILCSCITAGQSRITPWMKDNQRIGTVTTTAKPWGTFCAYKDLEGRLMRTEKRGSDGSLLSGACTVQRTYDSGMLLASEEWLDSNERMTCNADGFAVHQWSRSVGPGGNPVVEESFLDSKRRLALTNAGYAIVRHINGPDGKAQKVQLLTPARKPAKGVWLDVPNVAEVDFSYLDGVTPITCAVFLDASGAVVERKQISGLTAASSTVTEYHGNPTLYAPGPMLNAPHPPPPMRMR